MRIIRLVGAGDRELVRAQLLQLMFSSNENIVEHLISAHGFCKANSFRLRAYIPECNEALWTKINFEFLASRRSDDTDVLTYKPEEAQNILDKHIDVYLEENNMPASIKNINRILKVVMDLYPRQLVKKEHQHLSINELKKLYKPFFIDLKDYEH